MQVQLFAPDSYWKLTLSEREGATNGCGALGLVPDSIFGVDVREACNIHDWMYSQGETLEDKEEADRVLLNNMLRLIEAHSECKPTEGFLSSVIAIFKGWKCKLLLGLRRHVALGYYNAVCDLGGPFYWIGKNPPATVKAVPIVAE